MEWTTKIKFKKIWRNELKVKVSTLMETRTKFFTQEGKNYGDIRLTNNPWTKELGIIVN